MKITITAYGLSKAGPHVFWVVQNGCEPFTLENALTDERNEDMKLELVSFGYDGRCCIDSFSHYSICFTDEHGDYVKAGFVNREAYERCLLRIFEIADQTK